MERSEEAPLVGVAVDEVRPLATERDARLLRREELPHVLAARAVVDSAHPRDRPALRFAFGLARPARSETLLFEHELRAGAAALHVYAHERKTRLLDERAHDTFHAFSGRFCQRAPQVARLGIALAMT